MGRSVTRLPSERDTALAQTAKGATMGVSPTPRTPKGWLGLAPLQGINHGQIDATGIR